VDAQNEHLVTDLMKLESDHHLGLEIVNCYLKYFDAQEGKQHALIDKMAWANAETKVISTVLNTLSQAKYKKETLDFSADAKMKLYITHIHRNDPSIFGDLVKNVPDHLPAVDKSVLRGEDITAENVVSENLKEVPIWNVEIEPLTEDQIGVIIEGLEGALKMHSADLNEQTMHLHEALDNRSHMTEASRKVVQEDSEFKRSANSKAIKAR
jgi:hypothetical protein